MKRIAVDMDETIADALGKHLTLYNEAFGTSFCKDDCVGRGLGGVIPAEHWEAVNAMITQTEFFADLKVFPDAQDVIRDLTRSYEVFITTSAMEVPTSFSAKFEWLKQHFPFIRPSNIVFCGDKSILAADYLIDDSPRHFRHFRGEGILFSAPHNRLVTGFKRVDSWQDVRKLFLQAETEKSAEAKLLPRLDED